MKSLILISLLLISTNHFAQDKTFVKTELVTDQGNQWMTKIAADSQMRLAMMQMMIEQTVDKPGEMQLLVNQILSNSEMKNMIGKVLFQRTNEANSYMNKPGIMMEKYNKSNNVMKKTKTQKKPIIKE